MPSLHISTDGRTFELRHDGMTLALRTTDAGHALATIASWMRTHHTRPAPPATPPRSHLDSAGDAAGMHVAGAGAGIDTPSRWPAAALNPWPRERGA